MMEENGTMESVVGTVPIPTAQQEEMTTSSADADGDHPTRTDWLLLRDIIIFMLFLLAIFWSSALSSCWSPFSGQLPFAINGGECATFPMAPPWLQGNTQLQRRRQATK
jgi:hypothetical protein